MNNDIYHIDFTKIFPPALSHDPKMLALAQGVAAQMLAVSGHLEDVLIYSRFDELPEELVDVLAYDMHVDWYDYEFSLKEKREIVKNSVRVHKRMGTRYATEMALGSIFPGAQIQEWFEYGGKPYFFRAVVDVPDEGVTLEQKKRVLRGIHFYKNLRSHMDEVEYRIESTGFVRIGAYTAARHTLEIWPSLPTQLEITDAERVGAVATARHTLEVWPDLPTHLEITDAERIGAVVTASHRVEIFPELPTRLELTGKHGAGGLTASEHTVEVFPDPPTRLEITERAGAGGLSAARRTLEVFPELATGMEITERAGAGGLAASSHTVEVFPELPTRLEVSGQAGAGGLSAALHTVEVFPELATKVELDAKQGVSGIAAMSQTVEIYPEN